MDLPHHVRLTLLGPVELVVDGEPVHLERLERDLLVALHLAGESGERAARVQQQLWPELGDVRGRWYTLSSDLRRKLRARLGTANPVVRKGERYVLNLGPVATDVGDFRLDVAAARVARAGGEDAAAVLALWSALSRWVGEPLQDVADLVRTGFVAMVEDERLAAVRDLADLELSRFRPREVVPVLSEAAERHPLDQPLIHRLALALAADDRASEAVTVLVGLEQRLIRELGHSLDPDLEALRRRLARPDGSRPGPAVPPPPRPPLPLLCRDEDVDMAVRALTAADGAVVALSGPPGVGKTVVMLAVADRMAGTVPLRPFVDLGTASGEVSSHDVLGLLARALGVPTRLPDGEAEREALVRSLVGNRRMLFVLDNVQRESQLTAVLRIRWAGVLLVSRAALTLPGATSSVVRPLTAGASLEVLRRLAPGPVAADPEGASRIAALCDGLAQSLWPVAARLRDPRWSPSRLADRLADEGTRLDALWASFKVACDGLSAEALDAFEHLGLVGPIVASRWSTAAVLGRSEQDAERVLEELVDAYLLDAWQRSPGRLDGYRMHDLLQRYAAQLFRRRPEAAERGVGAARRLAGAYLQPARRVEVALHRQGVHPCGPPSDPAADAADPELVRWLYEERAGATAAVRLAAEEGAPELAAELGRALMSTFEAVLVPTEKAGGHFERWRSVGAQARVAAPEDSAVRAAVDAGLGTLQHYVSEFTDSRSSLEQAVRLFDRTGDRLGAAYASVMLAMTLRALGEPARSLLTGAAGVAADSGDTILEVQVLRCLSWQDRDALQYDRAVGRLERALELARGVLGPPRLLAYVLQDLGVMQTGAGRLAEAAASLDQALNIFTGLEDRHWEALTLLRLGELNIRLGEEEAAVERLARCMELSRSLHDRSQEAIALRVTAEVDGRQGRRELGIQRGEAALDIVGRSSGRQRAFVLVVLGELLLPTDTERARAYFSEAVELLRKAGVEAWLRRAEAGLRKSD